MRKLNGIKFIVFVTLVGVTFSLSVLFIKVSEQRSLSSNKETQASKKTLNALDCYVCEKLSWNQEYAEDVIDKNGITTFYNVKEEIDKRKRIEEERIEEERRLARLEDERIKEEKRQAEAAEQKRQEEIAARLAEEKKKRDAEKEKQKKQEIASRGSGYQSNYETTFYTAKCDGCTGQSASGVWVNNSIYYQGYRIVAAPPNLAFYTKLRITFGDGSKMDAIVLDRGKDIQGKRLDILVSSKDEAYRLGRQQVKVEVIK